MGDLLINEINLHQTVSPSGEKKRSWTEDLHIRKEHFGLQQLFKGGHFATVRIRKLNLNPTEWCYDE